MSSRGICWNAYPGLIIAGCFAGGIGLAHGMDLPLSGGLLLAATGLAPAAGALLAGEGRILSSTEVMMTASALVLVVAAGVLRYQDYVTPRADHISRLPLGTEVDVQGWIADEPAQSGRLVRFTLVLEPEAGGPAGKLLVYVADAAPGLRTCDVVRVRGELSDLPRRRNPGDFDYGAYLRRQRIYVRMFAESAAVVASRRSGLACVAADVRHAIERRIDRFLLDREARGVMRALLLGDKRAIDTAVRDRFARTGLLHLLAVSGLHVMVVGMILYKHLGPILMRFRFGWRRVELIRTITTALLLLAYMVLAGGTASVVRAVVMALLFMMATTLQRSADSMNTLGVAAFLILVLRPVHLFEPGFQLSMAAVGSIVGLMPQLQRSFAAPASKPLGYLHASLLVTTAATLGTLPVVLYHFGQAAMAGFLLNLPAIPITTALLVSGLVAIMAGELSSVMGTTIGASSDVLAQSLLTVSEVGDRYAGWALLEWTIDHPAPIIAMVLGVLAIGRWRDPSHRWTLLLLAGVVIVGHIWFGVMERRWIPDLEVIMLDVGQGDAAIVQFPNGEAMLVDAGPRSAYGDAGSDVILPQIDRLGIRHLHTVVITHPDNDHLGGLPAVLRAMPVGRVVRSGFEHPTDLYRETGRLLDSLQIPEQIARAGDTLQIDPNVRTYVLFPNEWTIGTSPNDHSVVLRISYGATSIIMTGDAPRDAELALVRTFRDWLRSDALKVGHHGSRTSSAPAFLSTVREGASPPAIISVAERNRYGLPDEDVLERLERSGFHVEMTGKSGAVWLRFDGRRVERVTY